MSGSLSNTSKLLQLLKFPFQTGSWRLSKNNGEGEAKTEKGQAEEKSWERRGTAIKAGMNPALLVLGGV